MSHPLFFVALLPDEEIQKEVAAFKQICADKFGAKHAFKSPPHITLHMPFRWPEEKTSGLENALTIFSKNQSPFSVDLKNFNCFPPRVLYVDMVKNDDLISLKNNLSYSLENKLGLKNKDAHGFNPHMTIAHRDLSEEIFPAAWNYFSDKKYEREFVVDSLVLLKLLDGKWEVFQVYNFDSNSNGSPSSKESPC